MTKDEQSSHTARCPSSQPSSSGVQAQRGSHKTGHSDPGVLGLAQTHVCTMCRHGSIRRGSFINQAGNQSGRKHTVSEMGEETGILCEKKKHLEGSHYITITNDRQNFRFKTVAAMCIFLPFPPPWYNFQKSKRVLACRAEKRKVHWESCDRGEDLLPTEPRWHGALRDAVWGRRCDADWVCYGTTGGSMSVCCAACRPILTPTMTKEPPEKMTVHLETPSYNAKIQ